MPLEIKSERPATCILCGGSLSAEFPGDCCPGCMFGAGLAPPASIEGGDKYEIGPVVAEGGMGAIHSARDLAIHRRVAMKVMLGGAGGSTAARFLEEAQITGQLEHPNIVPVHELGFDAQGQPFYTMKLVRGVTLKKVLKLLAAGAAETVAKYPLVALLTVLQKVCDAIAFAHSRHVIHRDLKPENIMLGDFGEVLVMDWGLAKVIGEKEPSGGNIGEHVRTTRSAPDTSSFIDDASSFSTLPGTVMGTPCYMAPEQASGEIQSLDARTDIYSLGAILYEILALHPPVAGGKVGDILKKVRAGELTPLTGDGPHLPGGHIPESLRAVCGKALALCPEHRYQNVPELQREITAYQEGFATMAEDAGLIKQIVLAVRRHRKEAAILAASLLLLGAVSAVLAARIVRERNNAKTALANLTKTAPTFFALSKQLVEQEKFDEALEKIGYAVSLDGRNPDYRLHQANLLQATQRIADATEGYRAVLALRSDDLARLNLDLCERLLRENPSSSPLNRDARSDLYHALLDQGRGLEAVPLGKQLRIGLETAEMNIKARLRGLIGFEGFNWARLGRLGDGTFKLDLSGLKINECPDLVGLPITELDIHGTNIADLSPLRGLGLRKFICFDTPAGDISPLEGMPITELNATRAKRGFQALHGMPLVSANLSECAISDLTPLTTARLEVLVIDHTACANLSPLRGQPIKHLQARETYVLDLTPLATMPITTLDISGTKVTDLNPIAGLPLETLGISGIGVSDFRPLMKCKSLRVLSLPRIDADIDYLRDHPCLVSIDEGVVWWDVKLPAAEFWKRYDARRKNHSIEKPGESTDRSEFIMAIFARFKIPPEKAVWSATASGKFDIKLPPPIINLSPLQGLPIRRLTIADNPDLTDLSPLAKSPLEYLQLGNCKTLRDLGPLAQCTELREIHLDFTAVSDLAPLKKLPLEILWLAGSKVSDLSPIRGMPLKRVYFDKTTVTDVSPLQDCPNLEMVMLPPTVQNVEVLRDHPAIQRLSYDWDAQNQQPTKTREEFWAAYDKAKK